MAESTSGNGVHDVDLALARLEERAKKRMRTRLPVAIVAGAGAAYLASRFGLTSHTRHEHHAHSTLRALIAVGVAVVFVAIVLYVFWKTRKRWRRLMSWTRPLPAAGLNWRDRRTVYRDIRRATPNHDPVLRAVEVRSVERIRETQPRWMLWIMPVAAVLILVIALLPDRAASSRIYYAVSGVFFILLGVAAFRLRRGVDRFPSDTT